jgi:hypothetical protein
MGFLNRLLGKKDKNSSETGSPKMPAVKPPKFVSKDTKQGSTYEVYRGTTAEAAKAFLVTKRVDKPQYYIVVETTEGNWGMDVKGLYLEHLLPWQTTLSSANCEGHTASFPDMFGLQMAAKGFNDNFIVLVKCGSCEHEWSDGVRYENTTVVRCPKCKTLNKVSTSHIHVSFV